MNPLTIVGMDGTLEAEDRTDCDAVTIRLVDDLGHSMDVSLDDFAALELAQWLREREEGMDA